MGRHRSPTSFGTPSHVMRKLVGMDKVFTSAAEAIADIQDGLTSLVSIALTIRIGSTNRNDLRGPTACDSRELKVQRRSDKARRYDDLRRTLALLAMHSAEDFLAQGVREALSGAVDFEFYLGFSDAERCAEFGVGFQRVLGNEAAL